MDEVLVVSSFVQINMSKVVYFVMISAKKEKELDLYAGDSVQLAQNNVGFSACLKEKDALVKLHKQQWIL